MKNKALWKRKAKMTVSPINRAINIDEDDIERLRPLLAKAKNGVLTKADEESLRKIVEKYRPSYRDSSLNTIVEEGLVIVGLNYLRKFDPEDFSNVLKIMDLYKNELEKYRGKSILTADQLDEIRSKIFKSITSCIRCKGIDKRDINKVK